MSYLGNAPALAYTSFAKQDFTVTATTSYSLDHPVANANELALFINFVRQEPTTSYSASGTTLTLTEATSSSDDMYCVYLGKAVQTVTPANNSVTNAMLSAGSFSNITGVGTLSSGLTLSDNILFDTASKGIYLGVTSATASNLLDDYEEGTWTPIYTSSSGSFSSITYDSEVRGFYTKIGKLVVAQAFIMTDAISVGTASGSALIGGLPFTVKAEDNTVDTGGGAIANSTNFGGDNPIGVFGQRNSTNAFLMYKATSNGNSDFLNVTDLGTGTNDNQMRISIIYRAD
jgi:hypothetical protein